MVLLLMGSVLYEVTRTESAGRQSAARTQDISLAAPQPVDHKITGTTRPDYIGRTSVFSASKPVSFDGDVAVAVGARSAAGIAPLADVNRGASAAAPYGRAVGLRARSASSSGFAQNGMNGVGAWGGVSGMMRISEKRAAAPKAAKEPKAAKAKDDKPKRGNSGSSGSGGGSVAASPDVQLAGGFTTGAAAVVPGAIVAVQTPTTSPASSPASTPEPMSMLLMGTGLVALYGARRRLS
jgi:hypothetical protein